MYNDLADLTPSNSFDYCVHVPVARTSDREDSKSGTMMR